MTLNLGYAISTAIFLVAVTAQVSARTYRRFLYGTFEFAAGHLCEKREHDAEGSHPSLTVFRRAFIGKNGIRLGSRLHIVRTQIRLRTLITLTFELPGGTRSNVRTRTPGLALIATAACSFSTERRLLRISSMCFRSRLLRVNQNQRDDYHQKR